MKVYNNIDTLMVAARLFRPCTVFKKKLVQPLFFVECGNLYIGFFKKQYIVMIVNAEVTTLKFVLSVFSFCF